jgi:integrase
MANISLSGKVIEMYPPASIPEGLILLDDAQSSDILAEEHASEPIKSLDDIRAVSQYFISNGKYRDNMLFIAGINFGLRVGDLLKLRFSHLLEEDLSFKENFAIFEQKTSKTRKNKKNRLITVNQAVQNAVILYLKNTPGVSISDFLFRDERPGENVERKALHRNLVERILKKAGKELGLPYKIATHTLRKTFGYHQMMASDNDPRKLLLLQKIFGHSSTAQTMSYIGLTAEEIQSAYLDLNLGISTEEAQELTSDDNSDIAAESPVDDRATNYSFFI